VFGSNDQTVTALGGFSEDAMNILEWLNGGQLPESETQKLTEKAQARRSVYSDTGPMRVVRPAVQRTVRQDSKTIEAKNAKVTFRRITKG
jgi:hypothetical protein